MWQLALPFATGLLSALGADRRNQAMKAQNKAEAEKTRYSAWSGLGGGQINNQYADPLMSGIGGGLQGASAVQALGMGAPSPTGGTEQMVARDGSNLLGGQDLAAQLGQGMDQFSFNPYSKKLAGSAWAGLPQLQMPTYLE